MIIVLSSEQDKILKCSDTQTHRICHFSSHNKKQGFLMITLTEHFLYVWAQPVNGLQQITRTLFPVSLSIDIFVLKLSND